jgi:4'-phosphopantetheinyl transferase
MRLMLDSVARCAAAWQRDRGDKALEWTRARAIAAPRRRAQFLAGRWLAARLMAQHAGGRPEDWVFSCHAGEAPEVLDGPAAARPYLSIAHRGDAVACALADAPVGIDVEVLATSSRSTEDARAGFVLHADERASFDQVPAPERAMFLLTHWTLKEAWAKRSRRGLVLGEMRHVAARPVPDGGNARLWQASDGVLVAMCLDDAAEWLPSLAPIFDPHPGQHWHVAGAAAP